MDLEKVKKDIEKKLFEQKEKLDNDNWTKVDKYTFKFTGAIAIGSASLPTHKETFKSYVNFGQLEWEITFLNKNDVIQKTLIKGTNITEATMNACNLVGEENVLEVHCTGEVNIQPLSRDIGTYIHTYSH